MTCFATAEKEQDNLCQYPQTTIDCFHDPIMQHVLGGSLHKNNTSCLLLGLYHASVNWLSIALMQIPPPPQNEPFFGGGEKNDLKDPQHRGKKKKKIKKKKKKTPHTKK